jgi:hypothetical protein
MSTKILHTAYIALFLIVLVSYVGCSQTNSGSQNTAYRTGSQALEMRFLSGNPSTIYDGDRPAFILTLNNKGTHDITQGYIYASGFDSDILPLQLKEGETFNIDGKDQFDPQGTSTQYITLESAGPVRLPISTDRLTQSIKVVACYEYKTLATAEVCVDPDPYNRRVGTKACQQGISKYGAQGHPIALSSAKARLGENDEYIIEFTLSNVGNGIVFDSATMVGSCVTGQLYETEKNKVQVTSVTLGGNPGDCEPTGLLRVGQNTGRMVCRFPNIVNPEGAYVSLLEVQARYGYRNEIVTQVQLLRE